MVFLAGYSGFWTVFGYLFGVAMLGLLVYENVGLRRLKLDALVVGSRHVEDVFGGFNASYEPNGGYTDFKDALEGPRYWLTLLVEGRVLYVKTPAEVFIQAQSGSRVFLLCSIGRFTQRIIPLSIEMPDHGSSINHES